MVWAESVDLSSGKARAHCGPNDRILIDFKALHNEGLPRPVRYRHTIRLPLHDGKRVNVSAAYIYPDTWPSHEIWETHGLYSWLLNGTTYLVPALALLRVFFRLPKLLAEIFRPQALERIALLDYCKGKYSPTVHMLIGGLSFKDTRQQNEYNLLLRWMLSHPSARRMAGSVHQHALQGHINLSLPNAVAYLEVTGVALQNSFFVTRCNLQSLHPEEAPATTADIWLRYSLANLVSMAPKSRRMRPKK
jgi:hypothetical protein